MSNAKNTLNKKAAATPIKVKYSSSFDYTTVNNSGISAKKGINGNMCIAKCLPGEEYCRSHLYLFNKGK